MLNIFSRAKCRLRGLCGAAIVVYAAPALALDVQVATWNVFDLPERFFPVASAYRCARVVEALADGMSLADTDAVVLTELYVGADRRAILAALAAHGFAHHAELGSPRWVDRVRYAGIVVATRWPIERRASMSFAGACHGADCLASKGAVLASMRIGTGDAARRVHVVGTHFYLGKPGAYVSLRAEQARTLAAWLRRQPIAADEPVLLAGDLNAAWTGDGPSLQATLRGAPVAPGGALDHTFVGDEHALAGDPRSGAAARCRKARGALPPQAQTHRKWVDYIWAIGPGARPRRGTQSAFVPSTTSYPIAHDALGACCTHALSDHHVVVGRYTFDERDSDAPPAGIEKKN